MNNWYLVIKYCTNSSLFDDKWLYLWIRIHVYVWPLQWIIIKSLLIKWSTMYDVKNGSLVIIELWHVIDWLKIKK